jgi:dUTP pyrophosphatase
MPTIKFKKVYPEAKTPTLASKGSACWDLYACGIKGTMFASSGVTLVCSSRVSLIGTGIIAEVPKGYFLEIRPRSGLSTEVSIVNSPGTIDSDFRGQIMVMLKAHNGDVFIHEGDRIAQCMLVPVIPIKWVEVDELSETDRGDKGFGSSGK